jgi:K+-sensing histidine kinase KdpD
VILGHRRRNRWVPGDTTSQVIRTHQLGGEFVHLHGRSVARTLVDYVHDSLATEVILGHRRRNRWVPGDTTSQVIRRLSGVDVHVLRVDR